MILEIWVIFIFYFGNEEEMDRNELMITVLADSKFSRTALLGALSRKIYDLLIVHQPAGSRY